VAGAGATVETDLIFAMPLERLRQPRRKQAPVFLLPILCSHVHVVQTRENAGGLNNAPALSPSFFTRHSIQRDFLLTASCALSPRNNILRAVISWRLRVWSCGIWCALLF
jgi:hypothetical protein